MRRRTFTGSLLAAPLAGLAAKGNAAQAPRKQHIAVIGAGAFGGWTALHLLRRGARVTLLEAWGPGHSRASSGGESRVIRHAYGSTLYVDMAKRALGLWREASAAWERPLFHSTGVLFMTQRGPGERFLETARAHLESAGVNHEMLSPDELARRYPQVNMEDIAGGLFEPDSGYLLARRACQAVVDAFIRGGGEFRTAYVQPGAIRRGELTNVALSEGGILQADQYVFACGPWLKSLFPGVLGEHLTVSRQEIFYFGPPPVEHRYSAPALPIWADFGDTLWYGIPGAESRGFKIADDTRGPELDPTATERSVTAAGLQAAKDLHRLSLSRVERSTADRVPRLSVHQHPQFRFHRRSPSGGRKRMVGGRRFRSRLQAWPSPR